MQRKLHDKREYDKMCGLRLAECREEKGLSQKELAEAIGYCVPQIKNYEKGAQGIQNVVRELAKVLGVSAEYLLCETDVKNPGKQFISVMLDEGAKMPTKAHETDAGYDIYSPEAFGVAPKGSWTVDTGVHMLIPRGYVGMIKSKSGLNVNHGLRCEGVVDAQYTGSIKVKMYNDSNTVHLFNAGDKITQIVILPIPETELVEVTSLEETERGSNGFGSSGVR